MPIERLTHLYDITARFGPSGFRGAHAIDLERVTDGDEVLAERELPARPITEAEFGTLLAGQAASLIQAADDARQERDARVAEALAEMKIAQNERRAAISHRERTAAENAELTGKLRDAGAEIASLRIELAEARIELAAATKPAHDSAAES